MKTEDFDYYLPTELIAQTPLLNRSDSRFLVLDKKTGEIKHDYFKNLINYLSSNDVLVLNDTKVIPARLIGEKEDTKAHIEVLLLKELGNNIWEALSKPARRVSIGTVISFGNGLLKAKCVNVLEDGIRHYEFIYDGIFLEVLDKLGKMPLPPYIHEELGDQGRYQTVYAVNPGSAAAPTAGLHFTKEILDSLKEKGVEILYITLHVGLGTFRPVEEADALKHKMHSEFFSISEDTANKLNEAIKAGKNIISVGTTTTRTLESAYNNGFNAMSDWTDIFIYPGYEFKVVKSLITNFHLPKSTLIMLVSALAGKDKIMKAYSEAVKEKYRFFSFGDSMFIK